MGQLRLNLDKGRRAGRRRGCGRKRIHSKGVAHRGREKVSAKTPLHINFKYRTQIRSKENLRLLKRAILNSRKQGLRIVHFSMQSNHIHLIVESVSNGVLTRGMRSLTITMAKGLGKGKVQLERYHLHVLRSVREAKNAVMYVCFNKQRHEKGTYSVLDDYSSLPARNCISEFVKKSRMTLRVMVTEYWAGDEGRSFYLRKLSTPSAQT